MRGGCIQERADLLNEAEAYALMERNQPDIICHLAWSVGGENYRNSADNLKWLEASLRLMRYFKGRRFIFAGSSSQYGRSDLLGRRRLSLYGTCKQEFETVAGQYCTDHDVSFASARYFTIYGPGDEKKDAAIPNAICSLLRGDSFRCEAPENLWDFIYVDDAAEATVKLIHTELKGALDIATGRQIAMRTVFQTIGEAAGCTERLSFNEENKAGISVLADVSRMETELGYTCPTSLEQGIRETVAWWRQRMQGR